MEMKSDSKTTLPTGDGDTWQRAVTEFTSSLSPAQRLAIEAPATVDDCLQILVVHSSRKRAFTRILQSFRPIIDPLKRFEGAIDVMAQMSTGIASPVWGPIRAAITVASEHFSTLERLSYAIGKIAFSLQRYQELELLFKSHEGVRQAMGALYVDLIWFCTRVIKYHSSRLRYLVVSFDKEFGNITASIDLHSTEIDFAAAAAHMKEAKEMRERMSIESRERELHQLHAWLSPALVEEDLERHKAEYLPGSLDWMVSSPDFLAWDESPKGNILQVIGPPGCGKSILAAYMVDYLQRAHPDCIVLYFFCNAKDAEKHSAVNVLRTLLAQLVQADEGALSRLQAISRERGWGGVDSYNSLKSAFSEVLMGYRQRESPQIYMIVDAYDDITDSPGYVDIFLGMCVSADVPVTIKALVTGRDNSTYTRNALPESRELFADLSQSTGYIRKYVERRVQDVRHLANTPLGETVVKDITTAAEGLWLYARLMVDEIVRAPSKELVVKYLASLPHGLGDLYCQILRGREAQMTEDERRFAQFLFLWLDISDVLPNFLSYEYDRLPLNTLDLIFRYVNGGSAVFDAAALARTLGTPLVQNHQVASTYELDFVHKSAYQYLDDTASKPLADLPFILRAQRLKPLYRAVAAVWYFADCPDSGDTLNSLRDDASVGSHSSLTIGSYFEMDYGLWNVFWATLRWVIPDELLSDAEPMLRDILNFLQSPKCLQWVEMATIINYSGNYRQLLDNVLRVRRHGGVYDGTTVLAEFNRRCLFFFSSWAYVIHKTTPWRVVEYGEKDVDMMPDEFEDDEVTSMMMETVEPWGEKLAAHLTDEDVKHSGRFTVCPGCLGTYRVSELGKHSPYGCRRRQRGG